MNLFDVESGREKRQSEIDAAKSIDYRRRLGQFSTPNEFAKAIAVQTERYLRIPENIKVLEPSMGTGSFVSALFAVMKKRIGSATGYELDQDFYQASVDLWNGWPVKPICGDFTKVEPLNCYDLVIANPPYSRHHTFGIEEKRRLQSLTKQCTGISVSGLAGLYCYFMLLSIKWMKPGAVGVWLIPSEWMSVNYGSAIREFLTGKVTLLRVHKFEASDVRFSDALVSSCVVWFRNEPPSGARAEFTYGNNLSKPERIERYAPTDLSGLNKWPPSGKMKTGEWKIGDFFSIRRGVVTGDNDFFVLEEDRARDLKIPSRYLKPILPSPRNVKVDHVVADDDGLPTNVSRRFLLDCSGSNLASLPETVRDYLSSGEGTIAKKNLCASRNVWYEQEQRRPTPFLCSYMGRGASDKSPVRFILNDTKAIVSNSFLMLYPRRQLMGMLSKNRECAQEIWNLLVAIPPQEILAAGRSYGGGLQKIEPRELSNVPCDSIYAWMSARGETVHHEDENGQLQLFA